VPVIFKFCNNMRSIFCGLIFLVVFVSCRKDSAYIPFSPKIVKVQNNYELANGDKVKVNVEGKNMKNLDLNKFFVEKAEITSKVVSDDTAFDIILPSTTFSDKKMSTVLSFYNGNEYAQFEIFAKGFPKLEPLSKTFTYPDEEFQIEGFNLSYNENYSEVLFVSESGLVKAKVLSANNFIIKFVIPKTAISGPIVYKTIVKEEALPRFLIFGAIEIQK